MAHIRLEPIQRQDDLLLLRQPLLEAGLIAEREGDQLLIAVEQVGDAALSDGDATSQQVLVDLWHGAVVG